MWAGAALTPCSMNGKPFRPVRLGPCGLYLQRCLESRVVRPAFGVGYHRSTLETALRRGALRSGLFLTELNHSFLMAVNPGNRSDKGREDWVTTEVVHHRDHMHQSQHLIEPGM
jgi:hypothetical protein